METARLLKNGRTTQKERIEAQRSLAHYNIIEKMDSAAWDSDGNRFLILPSILSMISNQGINDMMAELEEFQLAGSVDGSADGSADADDPEDDDE